MTTMTTKTKEPKSEIFTKTFLIAVPHDTADWEARDHTAEVAATIQDAINQGLRAVGDVTFDGAESGEKFSHRVDNTLLTYSVECLPAELITGATMTPGDVALGKSLEESSDYQVVPAIATDDGV